MKGAARRGMKEVFLVGKRGPLQVSLKLNLASDRGQHHPPRPVISPRLQHFAPSDKQNHARKGSSLVFLAFIRSSRSVSFRSARALTAPVEDPLNRPPGLAPSAFFLRHLQQCSALSLQNQSVPSTCQDRIGRKCTSQCPRGSFHASVIVFVAQQQQVSARSHRRLQAQDGVPDNPSLTRLGSVPEDGPQQMTRQGDPLGASGATGSDRGTPE